jgi:hypothetical protein
LVATILSQWCRLSSSYTHKMYWYSHHHMFFVFISFFSL